MEGTFFITLDYLKQLGACREGQREFQRVFPDGGEYQAILDRCADEGRLDFGSWLLNHIGATNDVRIYEEKIDAPNRGIIFAGDIKLKSGANVKFLFSGHSIEAGDGIKAGWGIEAGDGIKAGWGIEAGRGIEAGWGIKAGESIEAGEDSCVFAGLNINKSNWPIFAVVTAKEKPTNLVSGYWKPIADGLFKENNL